VNAPHDWFTRHRPGRKAEGVVGVAKATGHDAVLFLACLIATHTRQLGKPFGKYGMETDTDEVLYVVTNWEAACPSRTIPRR
jgi:hypothetical protein